MYTPVYIYIYIYILCIYVYTQATSTVLGIFQSHSQHCLEAPIAAHSNAQVSKSAFKPSRYMVAIYLNNLPDPVTNF